MPQHLLFNKYLLLTMAYSYNNIIIYTLYFLMLTTTNTRIHEYTFGFNPTNSLIATPPVSIFILPKNNMFESCFDLAE